MDNTLSKPVAWKLHHHDRYYFEENADVVAIAESMGQAKGDAVYSQEYVSALLAELEAKDKCIAEAEVRGVEKLAAAFKSWASDETFPDYEAQRHWATASQESLSFAEDLRNGGCDDR